MHFAVESITYEVNDIIHGLLKVVTSKNYSSDIFTSINLELIKKEIFSTEKITKELSKKIIEIEVLKGVPESDEIIPFNLILPTEKLSPSFKTIEGFSLQYFLIINIHLKDTSNSKTENSNPKTEIPINILKEEQTKILFDEKMNGMLEWLDEMDKFEEIIPQDFGETPLIKQSIDEFNNVEEIDSLHDLKEAEEKLKSDACLIKKVEFDW
ncbi:vacuolar sorting protein 26, putative [Entamoeba histolytica HM-1:IMSS-B]|nr:vacuolar sorting protein 26, putative [Entamoeba histolytica HM-1:IMSS-B]